MNCWSLCSGGTGASTAPETADGYRIAGYVEDLESLRSHLGLDALTLYGNSHGGCVALAYAGTGHPGSSERRVITNAPPRMDDAYKTAAAEVQRRFAETFPDGAERLAAAEYSGRRAAERYRRGGKAPAVPRPYGSLRRPSRPCGDGISRPALRGSDELGLGSGRCTPRCSMGSIFSKMLARSPPPHS